MGEHLRHEVGSACAGVHNGHRAEVHLPDDSARLRKGVVHDHVQQRLQQSTGVVKGVLCQEECKPASRMPHSLCQRLFGAELLISEVVDSIAAMTVKQPEMYSMENVDSSPAAAQLTVQQEESVVRLDAMSLLVETRGSFSVEDDPVDPKGAQG